MSQSSAIGPDTMIPELLAAHPQARAVLDRYGLSGCGGQAGPVESLEFFSRTHAVELHRLLGELRQAAEAPLGELPAGSLPHAADTIYRRFFKAAIVISLTLGAGWGAWLLWRIGTRGDFTAISIFDINAHGHAQVFGWVGLFIMGFAYQAFGRFRHAELFAPGAAIASFYLMLAGIVASTVGQIAHAQGPAALALALGGRGLELAAIVLFVAVIVGTYRRSGEKGLSAADGFVFASLGWFVVQAIYGSVHLYLTMTARTTPELLGYVATLQAPLRDMQIHGFMVMMILGVALRLFPGIFRLPTVPPRRAWTWLWVLNAAVVAEVALFLGYRATGSHLMVALQLVPWLAMLAGLVALVGPWRLWGPLPEQDHSGKFVRAAFGWLAVSMVMLVLLPAYGAASGLGFSHAYYGAIRHAITVGFVSMMILGMAAKVVPTLNGLDTRKLGGLWAAFVLLNVGCAMRVGFQVASDFWTGAFAVVGFSGVLELAAIAIWGVGLWRIMSAGARAERRAARGPAPARVAPDHRVADVLEWFPQAEPVLLRFGFTSIANPLLRRTLARRVSLAGACSMHGKDAAELVAELNAVIAGGAQGGPVAQG